MSRERMYDENSNFIGTQEKTLDKDGRLHITRYDTSGNKIGESYETTDWLGHEYIVHEDETGQTTAYSDVNKDFFGKTYLSTHETTYGREKRKRTEEQVPTTEDGDSEWFEVLFAIIGGIVLGGAKLLWEALKFVYYNLPVFLLLEFLVVSLPGVVMIYIFLIPALVSIPVVTEISYIFIVVLIIVSVVGFIPYFLMVNKMIRKKNIKYTEMLKLYFGWLLKGLFAYSKVLEKAEENNVYPKLTKKINKIIGVLHNFETKIKNSIKNKINSLKESKGNKNK